MIENISNESKITAFSQAQNIIREWLTKQGHDKCWYYPNLFVRLAGLFGLTLEAEGACFLPPRAEFERGCRIYQDDVYRAREQMFLPTRPYNVEPRCSVCREPVSGHHDANSDHCPRCKEYIGFHDSRHRIEDCLENALKRLAALEERLLGKPGDPVHTVHCGCGHVNQVPEVGLVKLESWDTETFGKEPTVTHRTFVAPCPWCSNRTVVRQESTKS